MISMSALSSISALTYIFGRGRNREKNAFWSVKHLSWMTGNSRSNASNMYFAKFLESVLILLVLVKTIITAE